MFRPVFVFHHHQSVVLSSESTLQAFEALTVATTMQFTTTALLLAGLAAETLAYPGYEANAWKAPCPTDRMCFFFFFFQGSRSRPQG